MVIGLHGRTGAGKNAAAKRLALLRPDVVEVSFAAKLKESAAAVLGCTVDDLERWKNDPDFVVVYGRPHEVRRGGQSMRSFLQRYGTEAHRDIFGADFWLDAALPLRPDDKYAYDRSLYVVTDVRFPNEADRVRDLGGTVVRVIGPDEFTGDSHVSELPLACDYGLNNAVRDDGFAALDRNLRILLDAISLPVAA